MRKTGMDNDPKHVEAAYEAALGFKKRKMEADIQMWEDLANEYKARIEKLEFALLTISEVPQIPLWVRDLAREALK